MSEKVRASLSSDAESERLERQAALYGGIEFLKPFLECGPREILDVGCGTGYFTRRAAAQLPGSRVVGLDKDPARLAFARARTKEPNAGFELGDMSALPFERDRFDLVFCRFALLHFPDPTPILREMARVSRPGGRVVAYDMVHDGIWFSPEKPAFSHLLRTAILVMRERGIEPSQGLYLASGMVRAGLADVSAHVIPHHALAPSELLEYYRQNWIGTVGRLSEILGTKFDEDLVERARTELERRSDDEFLLELTVLAHGRKAGQPSRK